MAEKTTKVTVTWPFFLKAGVVAKEGDVLELPVSFANEMINCNRVARLVEPVAEVKASPEPPKTTPSKKP